MSFIRVPDPHPGRCENYRNVVHGDGYVESVRCIDYEFVPHQCTFPEPTHVVTRGVYSVTKSSAAPKPWVKPE